MTKETRSIVVLLGVVGWTLPMPYTGDGLLDAYDAGIITTSEAQKLQSHSRLSWTAQRRELREQGASQMSRAELDAKTAALKAKLDAAAAKASAAGLWCDD